MNSVADNRRCVKQLDPPDKEKKTALRWPDLSAAAVGESVASSNSETIERSPERRVSHGC